MPDIRDPATRSKLSRHGDTATGRKGRTFNNLSRRQLENPREFVRFECRSTKITKVLIELSVSARDLCELRDLLFKLSLLP